MRILKPKLLSWLILLITAAAVIIDFPEKFSFSPEINFSIGPLKFKRDINIKKGLDLQGGAHLVLETDMKDIDIEDKIKIIYDFIHNIQQNKVGLEPFPTSLRIVNWIRFLSINRICDKLIDRILFTQISILLNNIEYHLPGNHLLENGFALLWGAYYFNDKEIYNKAKIILLTELEKQTLDDGGHFELSPMYHQIMLLRVLDSIAIITENALFEKELLDYLLYIAEKKVGWLKQVTFNNGDIPYVSDSTRNIAPTSEELFKYAEVLGIAENIIPLNESGYRKITRSNYEIFVDIGNIGAEYIPGHAHSDTFNFVLYVDNEPFIVDTGISTYEDCDLRISQRKTRAHNTVQIDNYEQTDVWKSFRVARRASVSGIKEGTNNISAWHNGYQKIGAIHKRDFVFNDDRIIILDKIISKKEYKCSAFLHFSWDIDVQIVGSDWSGRILETAKENVKSAGLKDTVTLKMNFIDDSEPPKSPGFFVTNPPYGERIKIDDIRGLYKGIGDALKKDYSGYTAWIISSNLEALKFVGLRPSRNITVYSGKLECKFAKFEMYTGTKKQKD